MIHRDYMGDETQMKVYDDHIWLWNAGELPHGYNTESLQREHRSILRNKIIASIFFQAGFIEHWGRGFDKVQAAFETNNIPFPRVENQFGGTSVYIQRETETQETTEKTIQKSVENIKENTIAENIVENIVENLSAMRGRIVKIIWKNPKATAQSISKQVEIAPRNVQEHLKYLQKAGILRRVGPDKGGYWEIIKEEKEISDC
jgi:ATP-dependent DNA helicase RecG